LWNAVLLLLGLTVGRSWERLLSILSAYGAIAGGLVALLAALLLIGRWRRRVTSR
jgi:membrane protein DedA with SNARE-associated domain